MNYILGASGQIGMAIRHELPIEKTMLIPRNEYSKWIDEIELNNYLKRISVNPRDVFYVCSGVTDPGADPRTLEIQNLKIPLAIAKKALERNFKVVTFGSVHEKILIQNAYMDSKRKFLESILGNQSNPMHKHFQLHTIYGGIKPKRHMLLSAIAASIRDSTILKMSSGRQFREYWHAQDVSRYITSADWPEGSEQVVLVSSGQPFQLAEMASNIYKYFNVPHLLRLGELPDAVNENYNPTMVPRNEVASTFMREPFPGIIQYLDKVLRGTE